MVKLLLYNKLLPGMDDKESSIIIIRIKYSLLWSIGYDITVLTEVKASELENKGKE